MIDTFPYYENFRFTPLIYSDILRFLHQSFKIFHSAIPPLFLLFFHVYTDISDNKINNGFSDRDYNACWIMPFRYFYFSSFPSFSWFLMLKELIKIFRASPFAFLKNARMPLISILLFRHLWVLPDYRYIRGLVARYVLFMPSMNISDIYSLATHYCHRWAELRQRLSKLVFNYSHRLLAADALVRCRIFFIIIGFQKKAALPRRRRRYRLRCCHIIDTYNGLCKRYARNGSLIARYCHWPC